MTEHLLMVDHVPASSLYDVEAEPVVVEVFGDGALELRLDDGSALRFDPAAAAQLYAVMGDLRTRRAA